jgi:hypothetical protein
MIPSPKIKRGGKILRNKAILQNKMPNWGINQAILYFWHAFYPLIAVL